VLIVVATASQAMTVEAAPDIQELHELGASHARNELPSEDPSWKRMSSDDKRLSKQQTEGSYFTGSMSGKERLFAAHQGSEKQLFALSHKDRNLAKEQSRVVLDKSGKDTLSYLTSEEAVSQQDLDQLGDVRKQALQHAQQLQHQLAQLNQATATAAAPHRGLHSVIDSIGAQLTEAMEEEEESQDLGEGMATGVGKHEKARKVEKQAQIKMTAETKRHKEEIDKYKREMKETVEKANRIRMSTVQKAQQIVPQAIREFDEKAAGKKRRLTQRSMKLEQSAMKEFSSAQARAINIKQEAALRHAAGLNRATTDSSRIAMGLQSKYQKELALFADTKTKAVARADKMLVEAKTQLQEKERMNREKGLAESRTMQTKFQTMMTTLKMRTKRSISSLDRVTQTSIRSAKSALDASLGRIKKRLVEAKIQKQELKKGSQIILAESKSDNSNSDSEKTKILQAQLKFKANEQQSKKKVKQEIGKVKQESNRFDLDTKKEQAEINQKEKLRENAMASKATVGAAEYKKRQMAWLASVKKSSHKNCKDAKREAILKTRASRFATMRLVRMSSDMATMKKHVLQDIKYKGKKKFSQKEKASKNLKKVIQSQAKAMQASPQSYDAATVEKASAAFAKFAGPEKSEAEQIKEASKKAKEAKKSAMEHSTIWAKKQNSKTALNLKNTATVVCNKEQHKYETVKYRVRKRLGQASEGEHKALLKGEFKDKKWALSKVTVLLGKKKKITEAGEKKKTKLTAGEEKKEKAAERKEKHKVSAHKEKQKKFKQAAKMKEQQAKKMTRKATATRKAKEKEAKELKAVAQKSYKKQLSVANKKLKEGKVKLLGEEQKELRAMGRRKASAMKVLKRGGKSTTKGDYERAVKKSKEHKQKARSKEKERVSKATKSRDDKKSKLTLKTKQEKSRLKLKLENAKSEAQKIVTRSKMVLAKKKQEAKGILAEGLKGKAGEKQAAVMEAKLKADKMLSESKKALDKATKDARKIFIAKVKKATAKYLTQVKGHREGSIASIPQSESSIMMIQLPRDEDDIALAERWAQTWSLKLIGQLTPSR